MVFENLSTGSCHNQMKVIKSSLKSKSWRASKLGTSFTAFCNGHFKVPFSSPIPKTINPGISNGLYYTVEQIWLSQFFFLIFSSENPISSISGTLSNS